MATRRASKSPLKKRLTRKTARAKPTEQSEVQRYLASAPKGSRAALEKLRKTVRSVAPKAIERISYGILGFKHNGKPLVYLGHWKGHCALYGLGQNFLEAHADKLAAYKSSKGTIRFTPDAPIPASLVRTIVKARMAEIDGG